jgi:CheY-like chemotaxis protein
MPTPGRVSVIVALDDSAVNLTLLERIFAKRPDISIVTESDGKKGVARIEELLPDLVLMDLHLAGCDSESIVRGLQSDPRTVEIPVVMISGDVAKSTKTRLGQAGARAFLEKPFTVEDLLAVVDDLLGGGSQGAR